VASLAELLLAELRHHRRHLNHAAAIALAVRTLVLRAIAIPAAAKISHAVPMAAKANAVAPLKPKPPTAAAKVAAAPARANVSCLARVGVRANWPLR